MAALDNLVSMICTVLCPIFHKSYGATLNLGVTVSTGGYVKYQMFWYKFDLRVENFNGPSVA